MRDSLHDAPAPPRLPLLYFEYGADETTCEQGIEVSERGMCFHSRWQFAPGTQLGITVSFTDSEGNLQRAGMEAFVVECVPSECGCHRVTLLFLELEDRFRPALRSLRGLVADPRHSSAAGRRWRSRTVWMPATMKRTSPLILIAAAACAALAVPASADEQWTADYAKAMKQAKAENKAVLLDFTGSDWCEWCIKMKKETLDSPAFKNYASKNLVLVEVDFPRTKPQPQEVKAQNQELSSRFKIDGFPSFVILNANGKELGRQVGYLEGGPMAFLAELKKFYKPAPRGTAETGSGDFDIFAKKPAATPAP